MQHILILCPVYNDEDAFTHFAAQIEEQVKQLSTYQFSFLVINDGSFKKPCIKSKLSAKLIHLYRNLGHQKAIAIGLSYAYHQLSFDKVIVMDADGEDKPSDIISLIKTSEKTGEIIVAKRIRRQEGIRFKLFYSIYKFLFRLFTGQQIFFGNFMLLPKLSVGSLIHQNEIWNHLASTIIKSKMPYQTIPSHRGKRYEGKSKMNFASLVLHGLSAIGVFIEIIAVRLLIFSLTMIFIAFLMILIILGIKFLTNKAIPGWATTAVSSMLIILLQSFLLSLFTIFLYITSQSQRKFIPALHYTDYIQSVETIDAKTRITNGPH